MREKEHVGAHVPDGVDDLAAQERQRVRFDWPARHDDSHTRNGPERGGRVQGQAQRGQGAAGQFAGYGVAGRSVVDDVRRSR